MRDCLSRMKLRRAIGGAWHRRLPLWLWIRKIRILL